MKVISVFGGAKIAVVFHRMSKFFSQTMYCIYLPDTRNLPSASESHLCITIQYTTIITSI